MDILHLIDRLEELVAEARRMPIGQGVVVDRRRILELVDQMRSSVPWEVREAERIVTEKDEIIEEARREAEGILERADMEAQERLDDTAIVQQAERESQAILARAEERAQVVMDDAQAQVRRGYGRQSRRPRTRWTKPTATPWRCFAASTSN